MQQPPAELPDNFGYSRALEAQLSLANSLTSEETKAAAIEFWDLAGADDDEIKRSLTLSKLTEERLPFAETFFLAESINPLVQAGADSLGDWICTTADFYVPSAFVYLEKPFESTVTQAQIRYLFWSSIPWEDGTPGLLMAFAFGEVNELYWAGGVLAEGERLSDSQHFMASPEAKVFVALNLFMQQRILSSSPVRASRATRKRIQEWRPSPVLKVIHLRRKDVRDVQEPLGESPDWSCRWLVRGHWRQQPYPSQGISRPLWISPYVKGPEDKPLRVNRAEVFAVVR